MINQIIQLLHQYPVQAMAVEYAAQYLLSAFVDSLPQPKPMGSQLYQFLFTFGHKVVGNLSRNTSPMPPTNSVTTIVNKEIPQ